MTTSAQVDEASIVVAVDASAPGEAMAWAAAEATQRGVGLHTVRFASAEPSSGEDLARSTATLLQHSVGADLMVVGASPAFPAGRWLRICSPDGAPRSSPCPIVVVRGRALQTPRRIVVGVSGAFGSDAAVEWALDEARRHDAALVVVRAWQRGQDSRLHPSLRRDDLAEADAHSIVSLVVRQCQQRSDGPVFGEAVEGDAAEALAAAASDADLLVVGSRGRHGFKTLRFGSVTAGLVEVATCPVAVVPPWTRWASSAHDCVTMPDVVGHR